MNNIELFKNENFGEIRTLIENEQVLFCGSDIAKALGYKKPNNVINQHCKKGVPRNTVHPQSPDKTIEMVFISESHVYRLIINSKLPQAEEFERWLFEDVLPNIRKNGGYIYNQENLTKALIVAQNVINEKDKLNKELQLKNSELSVYNQIMKPKADYFDELVDRNLLTSFRETANQLGIKEKLFIKFLLDKKGKLMPYADKNNGLFEIRESVNEKTKWTGTQTLITPKGRETFRLLFI